MSVSETSSKMTATHFSVSSALTRFVTLSAKYSSVLSVISIFFIMVVIGTDIVGRFFFDHPLQGSTEIATSLMVFAVMLALARAESAEQHIRITFVTEKLSPRAQSLLNVFAYLLGICLFVPIILETWEAAWSSLLIRETMGGPLPVPFYPSKFAVPVGSGLLILQFLVKVIKNIKGSLSATERAGKI